MVDKERKQDLSGPEEEALEQRVREMMDVSVPDTPEPEAPVEALPPSEKKKIVPITITHDDEPAKKPAAKPKAKKADTKSEVAAAAESINEQLAQEVGTAPLLGETPATKPKKITVAEHVDEPETAPELEEPAAVVEPEEAEETLQEAEQPEAVEPTEEPDELVIETEETLAEAAEEPDPQTEVGSEPEPQEEVEADEESPLEAAIESPETDKAVADIIAKEGDELLDVQDSKVPKPLPEAPKQKAKKKKRKSLLGRWFGNPISRWLTIIVLVVSIGTAGANPTSRYYILNKAGVRSSASIVVTDRTSLRPLKNVEVSIAGRSAKTDAEGKATLTQLPLGPTQLTIQKRAFATVNRNVTIGWGSNPLESVNLKPEGDQHTFVITDAFSGKPITNVQAHAGDADAASNDKGELVLTVDAGDEQEIKVELKAEGYRSETVTLVLSSKDKMEVKMVSAHPIAFVSKRTGKYTVYKVDADGKNETQVLEGTGKEASGLVLATNTTSDVAALVSTREGTRTDKGALLKTLTFINLKDNSNKAVISAPDIKLIDWIGSRLVYVQLTTAGNEDPSRYKLMSYDYVSGDNRQLAAANYFNSVVSLGGQIIYSPASVYQNGINVGVFGVKPDGTKKQQLLNQEAWNLLRTNFDRVTISVQQDWYEYVTGGTKADKLEGQPSNTSSRLYSDSPYGKHSVWIDTRDGKGTLLLYNVATKEEKVLVTANGIKGPVRWLDNDTIVYRLANSVESADYVLNISINKPQKIIDLTDVPGVERWVF